MVRLKSRTYHAFSVKLNGRILIAFTFFYRVTSFILETHQLAKIEHLAFFLLNS